MPPKKPARRPKKKPSHRPAKPDSKSLSGEVTPELKEALKEFENRAKSSRAFAQEEELRLLSRQECRDIVAEWSLKNSKASDRDLLQNAAILFAEAFLSTGTTDDCCKLQSEYGKGRRISKTAASKILLHLHRYAGLRIAGWNPTCIDEQAPVPFNLPKCHSKGSPEIIAENTKAQDAAASILLLAGQNAFLDLLNKFATRWSDPQERNLFILAGVINRRPLDEPLATIDRIVQPATRQTSGTIKKARLRMQSRHRK